MPTYLITGANRGVGLELTRQLSKRGDRVIGAARTPGGADKLKAATDFVTTLDVSSEASVAAMAKRLSSEKIDVLINNAGIFPDTGVTSFLDTPAEDLLEAQRVNVVGPMLLTRALLPQLEAENEDGKPGRKLIVHITSNMGSITEAAKTKRTGHLAYSASKAALNMVHTLMANELKPRGITCVAMHPGWIKTDMGGENAELELPAACKSILKTLDALTPKDHGAFVDFDKKTMKW